MIYDMSTGRKLPVFNICSLTIFLKEYMFIFNIILKIDKNNISRFLKKKIYNYP